MQLTEASIRAAKPNQRPYMIGDGAALYLRVSPKGRKSFVLRMRHGGRARKVTLGVWPHLGLADARHQASARKAGKPGLISNGKGDTAATVVQDYYDTVIEPEWKATKNAKVYVGVIKKELAGVAIRRLTREQIRWMVQGHKRRGRVAANRLLEFTKRFLGWCVEAGYIDVNPAADMTRRIAGGEERSRDRILSLEEIRAMWHRDHSTTPLLRFLLLTGLRIGEAQKARLEHISGDVLMIPPEHSKNGKEHRVHLTALARAQVVPAAAPYLFCQRTATCVQHSIGRWQASNDVVVRWTPHDLRRTFASDQAKRGIPPHVIQSLLNHTMEGTLPIYVRGSTYWPERVAALEAWSEHVAKEIGQ